MATQNSTLNQSATRNTALPEKCHQCHEGAKHRRCTENHGRRPSKRIICKANEDMSEHHNTIKMVSLYTNLHLFFENFIMAGRLRRMGHNLTGMAKQIPWIKAFLNEKSFRFSHSKVWGETGRTFLAHAVQFLK